MHIRDSLTSVVVELPVVHVDDVGAHAVHEVLGVGHHDEDALEVAEHLLQPHARLQVQMVGGLVQDAVITIILFTLLSTFCIFRSTFEVPRQMICSSEICSQIGQSKQILCQEFRISDQISDTWHWVRAFDKLVWIAKAIHLFPKLVVNTLQEELLYFKRVGKSR